MLLGAIIVVSFVADTDKAAETPIEFQTKAADITATDEIRVSNISDKEDMVVEALGISVEGLDRALLPEIGCLAIRQAICRDTSCRKRPARLGYGINCAWHAFPGLDPPRGQSIDQNGRGSAVIDDLPSRDAGREDKPPFRPISHLDSRVGDLDDHIGALQLRQGSLGDQSGSAGGIGRNSGEVGLAAGDYGKYDSKNSDEYGTRSRNGPVVLIEERGRIRNPVPKPTEQSNFLAGLGSVVATFIAIGWGVWLTLMPRR